jgi:hypothetical protein
MRITVWGALPDATGRARASGLAATQITDI